MTVASSRRGSRSDPRAEPQRQAIVIVGAALAVAVGVLIPLQPGAAAAVAAVLVLGAGLAFTRSFVAPTDLAGKRFHWVVLAWVYVMIRPIGHFTTGRTTLTAVGGVPSVENVLDLGIHGLIAAAAIWSLRRNRFALPQSLAIFALPALALLSTAWSLAPTVTLGFSFELVAIYLLAALTAAIYGTDQAVGRSILQRTLRAAVLLVALLCLVGLAVPHHGADSAAAGSGADNRFTWPGEHPLVATAEIGFAMLVILFATHAEIGFRRAIRVALLVLFGACLYLGNSRTAFAGVLAAGLFGAWFVSKGSGWARRLAGAGAIVAVLVLIVASFGGPITSYLYRGQSQAQVNGLNGRLGLWTFALHQLHTPGQWLFGHGLSSTRVFLATSVQWAGDAHGAWIELLLSLGLVGVGLAVVLIASLAVRLFSSGPDQPLPSRVIPILFVYVIAMSPVATGFAAPGPEPGLGFAVLAFCYAATAVREPARAEASAASRVRLERQFRTAPT